MVVGGGGGEIEDDGQSATYRPIRLKGVGVAGQEETLDARQGKGSTLAHPKSGNAPALRRGRGSFDL